MSEEMVKEVETIRTALERLEPKLAAEDAVVVHAARESLLQYAALLDTMETY